MIKYARIVLQDCKHAIDRHTINLQSEEFRISWISVITLLRSVGYVLEKRDSKIPQNKKAIEEKWKEINKTKPEPKIFWEFIEKERNRFLKEYEHGIKRVANIDVIDTENNIRLSLDLANSRGGTAEINNKQIKSFISSGTYSGQNEKEVAWIAYKWWEKYLDEIDTLIKVYAIK